VAVPPRPVVVHELELTGFAGPEAVSLRVRCSKGTYVRALAADLGRALGVGAHVTALRRTRSGPFSVALASPLAAALAALQERRAAGLGRALLTLDAALEHLPRCSTDEAAARDITQGRRVSWRALAGAPPDAAEGELYRVLRPDGSLLAVAARRADDSVKSMRVFHPPAQKGQPRSDSGRQNDQQGIDHARDK
jgi:tRNA pseudouridine55 synthase